MSLTTPAPTVLLVEGEVNRARSYRDALLKAGFQVMAATTGPEALKTVEKYAIDLVITAATIPKMDGIELVRRLKARLAAQPIVLLLQALDNQLAQRGVEAGAWQHLVKPEPRELEASVTCALKSFREKRAESAATPSTGDRSEALSVTATQAKNEFGQMLDKVIEGRHVVITKHETPKAVMIPYAEFQAYTERDRRELNSLSAEFDALLAQMQTPAARSGLRAALRATPAEMGKAAVAEAKKRG